MWNHTSRHAWKIRRQFFMASMVPCMMRRMVAHFGQPGGCRMAMSVNSQFVQLSYLGSKSDVLDICILDLPVKMSSG